MIGVTILTSGLKPGAMKTQGIETCDNDLRICLHFVSDGKTTVRDVVLTSL